MCVCVCGVCVCVCEGGVILRRKSHAEQQVSRELTTPVSGPFIVMVSHMIGDVLIFFLLYLEFYIPYSEWCYFHGCGWSGCGAVEW